MKTDLLFALAKSKIGNLDEFIDRLDRNLIAARDDLELQFGYNIDLMIDIDGSFSFKKRDVVSSPGTRAIAVERAIRDYIRNNREVTDISELAKYIVWMSERDMPH